MDELIKEEAACAEHAAVDGEEGDREREQAEEPKQFKFNSLKEYMVFQFT